MIYFIEAVGVGLIKIGVTDSLPVRMRTLRAMSPVPPRCLGTMDGGTVEEEEIHGVFGHLCSHDEWSWPLPPPRRLVDDNARPADEAELAMPRKRRRCPDKTMLYCPEGFAAWLVAFASWRAVSITGAIDEAARYWADRHGHHVPPRLPEASLTPSGRYTGDGNQVVVPATGEWRGRFNDVADRTGRDVNKVMRGMLRAYAGHLGYPPLSR